MRHQLFAANNSSLIGSTGMMPARAASVSLQSKGRAGLGMRNARLVRPKGGCLQCVLSILHIFLMLFLATAALQPLAGPQLSSVHGCILLERRTCRCYLGVSSPNTNLTN